MVIRKILDSETGELNSVIHNAVVNSDIVIGLFKGSKFFSSNTRTEAVKRGTRIISTQPGGIEDYIIQAVVEVDFQKMRKNVKLMANLWEKSQKCHIISSIGTDLNCEFHDRPAHIADGAATTPGDVQFFPGAQVIVAPIEETINGTIVVDGMVCPGGIVSSPVTIKMEKGVIANIEGKADANAWESWLKSLNDPIIYHLSHLNIGFNPLAKMNDNATEAERVLGAVTFGFGHQPNFLKGNITTGKFHTEAILASPTIYLDGKIVLMDNKLDEKLGFVKMV